MSRNPSTDNTAPKTSLLRDYGLNGDGAKTRLDLNTYAQFDFMNTILTMCIYTMIINQKWAKVNNRKAHKKTWLCGHGTKHALNPCIKKTRSLLAEVAGETVSISSQTQK